MNMDKQKNIEPSGDFAASIRNFRSVVTHVAERETARPVAADWLVPARKRRRSHQQRVVLGWACAAILCFATLPWLSHSHPAAIHPVASVAATLSAAPPAESDSALLEQVDADVSESVPTPLAPLEDLDSPDTVSTNGSGVSSGYGKSLTSTEKANVAR
jgi:hypothetical protein